MSNESWKCEVGFEEQTSAWGTIAAGTIGVCEFFRFFEGHDLWMTPDLVDLTGTESTRDKVDYSPGTWQVRGRKINGIEILSDRVHHLLDGLFGSVSGAGTVISPYVFVPSDDALPDYTIWLRTGDVYSAVVGAKIHSGEFTFESGTAKVSLEIRAKQIIEKASGDDPFPDVLANQSNKTPFMFWGAVVNYGTYGAEATIQAKSANITIENGLPENDMVSGERYTTEHTEGVRTVTGSFQLTFDSYDKITDFIASNEKSLIITATNPDGDTLVFEIPRIVHTPDLSIEEVDNLWRITMPWEAYKKDTYDLVTATLSVIP